MRGLGRRIAPLLLPFVLSLVPLVMAIYFEGLQRDLAREAKFEAWEEKVGSRIEEFRAGHSLTQQIRRRSEAFQNGLRRALSARSAPTVASFPTGTPRPLSGELLVKQLRRCFRGVAFPPGTKVYAFSRDRNGTATLLSAPGLEDDWGRMIVRCLSPITQDLLPGIAVKKEVNQRLGKIFGELLNYEQLFIGRGRKLIRANFQKRIVHLFWDRITLGRQVIGGFLLIFPDPLNHHAALKSALRRHIWRGDPECQPFLRPILAARDDLSPIFLERETRTPGMARLLTASRNAATIDEIAPFGKVSDRIPGLSIVRAAVGSNLPYDLLVMKPEVPPSTTPGPTLMILALVWAVFWLATFSRIVQYGAPLAISMRTWFLGYILLTGGIPLAALFFMGEGLIRVSAEREIREQIGQARALFESMDMNSMTAMTGFVEKAQATLADRAFKEAVCSDEISSRHPIIQRCFTDFLRSGIPLDSIFLVQFGRRNLLMTRDDSTQNELREVKDFFLPLFHASLKVFEPQRYPTSLAVLSDFQKWAVDLCTLIFPEPQIRGASALRQTGSFFEAGEESVFHLYDFVAREKQVQAGLVFRVKASEVFWMLAKRLLVPISKTYQHQPFLSLWNSPYGQRRFSPTPPARNHRSRLLSRELSSLCRNQAGKVKRFGEIAFIGHAGKRMKNLFLGTVIDFRQARETSATRLSRLRWGVCGIAGLMLFVGIAMGRYFLAPLQALEIGFRGVLQKNLDIRLGLARDDELGDVASAFDRMVEGMKERRELGRFVSETLNLSLEKADLLPKEPEVRVGAVLASDIRNFTTISEQNSPEAVVEMLNLHLDVMSREISTQGGLIDKFIGDAIVAVFLEPTIEASVAKALLAARGMMARHREIYRQRSTTGRVCYAMGIGIADGEVLVGTFGSSDRLEFTVLGHPREKAEELEAASKQGKYTRIVVAATAAARCPDVRFAPLGAAKSPNRPQKPGVENPESKVEENVGFEVMDE